jgi:hypothetical protein
MQDKKGTCLLKFIIVPIIETIEGKIKEYEEVCRETLKNAKDNDTLEKFGNYFYNAKKLLNEITLKEAHAKVLRYIAPHFQLEL